MPEKLEHIPKFLNHIFESEQPYEKEKEGKQRKERDHGTWILNAEVHLHGATVSCTG